VRVTQKNGKDYYRHYRMDYDKVKEDLAVLYNRKEYARGVYVITTCAPEDVRSVYFENAYGEETAGKPYSEEVRRLAEALKEDLKEAKGGDVFSQTPVGIMRCSLPDDGRKIKAEEEYAYSQSFRIYPSYKRTLALLEDMGFDTSMPKPERIKVITSYDENGKETRYTDPAIIRDLSGKLIPDCCIAPWLERADPDISYSMTLYPGKGKDGDRESLEISCVLLK